MKFDGLILFDEINGCEGNAYLVDKGVVLYKLEGNQSTNNINKQLNLRCGSCYVVTTEYWSISGGTETYNGSGPSYTTCEPPCSIYSPGYSYDSGYSSSTSSGYDPYYSSYLSPYQIDGANRICPQTFQFTTRIDPNGNGTHLAAGMRNDGISWGTTASFGFNHVTFFLPQNSPNFPNLTNTQAAQVLTQQFNRTYTQIGQQVGLGTISTNSQTLSDAFWSAFNTNMSNTFGVGLSYMQLSNSPIPYNNPNTGATGTWAVYNVPIVGCQ
jgi:hypothetical protein